MAIDGPKIDGLSRSQVEHVEPWCAGEQRCPDSACPAKGKLIVPALDDGFGLGACSLIGGIALEASLHVETPRRGPWPPTRPCVAFLEAQRGTADDGELRHGRSWMPRALTRPDGCCRGNLSSTRPSLGRQESSEGFGILVSRRSPIR